MSDETKPKTSWVFPVILAVIGCLNARVAEQDWQFFMGCALLVISGVGFGLWISEGAEAERAKHKEHDRG